MSGKQARPQSPLTRALVAEIRAERNAQRMTQHDLVRKSGVSSTSLANIEAGHRVPNVAQLEAISVALGVDIPTLYTRATDRLTSEDGPTRNRQSRLG